MEIDQIVRNLQHTLVPAVMISSTVLLLLGLQTKFSNLASRFRSLNQEKRALAQKAGRNTVEEQRFLNLGEQCGRLLGRATHVKNAILLCYASIISFILASLAIFMNVYAAFQFYPLILLLFFAGFSCLLAGTVMMLMEVTLAYHVVWLESRS